MMINFTSIFFLFPYSNIVPKFLYSQKSTFATNTRIQSIRRKVESHIPRRFILLRLLTMKYVMFYGRDFGLGRLS